MSEIPQIFGCKPAVDNHPTVGDLQEITNSNNPYQILHQEQLQDFIESDESLLQIQRRNQEIDKLVSNSQSALEQLKARYNIH